MPKFYITLLAITLLAVGFVTMLVMRTQIFQNDIKIFNKEFEAFNRKRILGTELVSAINKVMNHNEKYKEEPEKQIELTVRLVDFGEDITINMERIYELGVTNFTLYYGKNEFHCKNIEYDNNTGKVCKLEFESN